MGVRSHLEHFLLRGLKLPETSLDTQVLVGVFYKELSVKHTESK